MLDFFRNIFSKTVVPEPTNKQNDVGEKSFKNIDGPTKNFIFDEDHKPNQIRLVTDDYHLEGLGRLNDGTFFLTCSQLNHDHKSGQTTDYMCKFCFDSQGNLTDHTIVKIGVRGEYDHEDGANAYTKLLPAKGTYKDADFFVKPFSVDIEGVEFGLIIRIPEDEDDLWAVEFMPGNTMAFFEPWDSGVYDT